MEHSVDILDNSGMGVSELSLSPNAISFLNETRKWSSFLAILGFIFIGLMVLFGLFASTIFGFMTRELGTQAAGFSGFFGVMYIVIALLYFFPVFYLYKFGARLKVALGNRDNLALESAFENLKSHYKFIGIFTIVTIGFYILAAVFGAVAGLSTMNF